MNYPKIATFSRLQRAAQSARRAGKILATYGAGGSGKTESAASLAEYLGIEAQRVFLRNFAGALPSDVRGMAVPEAGAMRWHAPAGLPLFAEIGDEPALLILDEFAEWSIEIQALFRSVWQPGGGRPMVGPHELSAQTFVVVTGNRRCDGSPSKVPSAPMVSRSMSFIWEPTVDSWLDWAAERGLAGSPVFAFLKFNSGLDQRGREGDFFAPAVPQPWSGDAHPTPRQWAAACMLDLTSEDALEDLWALVGEPAAKAAHAFAALIARLIPTLDAIRAGTQRVPFDQSDQYALAHAAIRIVARDIRADPDAAVAAGNADWLVDMLLQCRSEIREWAFRTATSRKVGIPLQHHPKRALLQGV